MPRKKPLVFGINPEATIVGDVFGSEERPHVGRATKKLSGAVEPAYSLTGKAFTKKKPPKNYKPQGMAEEERYSKRPKF